MWSPLVSVQFLHLQDILWLIQVRLSQKKEKNWTKGTEWRWVTLVKHFLFKYLPYIQVDRVEGERVSFPEIQKLVLQELDMGEGITEEEKEVLLADLWEFCEMMKKGMRANNAAAAQDVGQTVKRMGTEVSSLLALFSTAHLWISLTTCMSIWGYAAFCLSLGAMSAIKSCQPLRLLVILHTSFTISWRQMFTLFYVNLRCGRVLGIMVSPSFRYKHPLV